MSSPSSRPSAPLIQKPPPPIRWRNWPLRDDVLGTVGVVAGLVAAWVVVRWATGQTHLALLALAFLVVALWRFFLPVWYELSVEGVDQQFLGRRRRIPWTAIRRYEACSTGILLLPHADRCPMDAFRGVYLPWGNRHEEVLARVRFYLDRPKPP